MSEYTSTPSTGKLKLKGVKDSNISKKKKKKAKPTTSAIDNDTSNTNAPDNSVVLSALAEEDTQITKSQDLNTSHNPTQNSKERPLATEDEDKPRLKTPAEERHEQQRRKRLEDRLKKEGVKTHKQRVEELNVYLSGLSEHHDMPKIGPG